MKELDEQLADLNAMITIEAKRISIMYIEGQFSTEAFDTNVENLYNLTRKRIYLKSIIKSIPEAR